MTDLETRIVDTLRHRPEPRIHVGSITAEAVRTGRFRRRRAVAVRGLAVAAAVAAVGGAFTVVRPDGVAPGAQQAGAPRETLTTTLPVNLDAPTAARKPGEVGTDPGVLHFDLDAAAAGASLVTYRSERKSEEIEFRVGSFDAGEWFVARITGDSGVAAQEFGVGGARDENGNVIPSYRETGSTKTDVAGRPATFRTFDPIIDAEGNGMGEGYRRLDWQPVDGLHASVVMRDGSAGRAPLVAATAALRFDRAHYCAAPIRLATLPAGTRWTGCVATIGKESAPRLGRWLGTGQMLTLADGSAVEVSIGDGSRRSFADADADGTPAPFTPNRTVGGRPALWEPSKLAVADVGPFKAEVFGRGMTEADATVIGAGLIPSGDPADISTWAIRPVG